MHKTVTCRKKMAGKSYAKNEPFAPAGKDRTPRVWE